MKFLLTCFLLSSLLYGGERGWNSLELATAYLHHSEPQRGWAWELLEQYPFNGSEKVLDFGCGDGKITSKLSSFLPLGSITGVDASSHMIQLAKMHFPNLDFRQTTSSTFSEITGTYDVIVSFSVFHFVDQPVEILRNFKNHLHPDGRLLLTIPLPPSGVTRLAADEYFSKYGISPPWHLPNYSSKLSMRSVEGCKQKLEEAGYDILLMQKIDTPSIFPTIDDFTNWLIGTASANWGVPFDVSQPFFTDVVKKMLELDPALLNEQGCIILPQSRIHVIAKPI